jgi:hypothetical protein
MKATQSYKLSSTFKFHEPQQVGLRILLLPWQQDEISSGHVDIINSIFHLHPIVRYCLNSDWPYKF